MMQLDLTIAIPVKNEEKNLAGCLRAIGGDLAKKIVLIDSGSTDNTRQIAESFSVPVVDFVWNGKFPKKRNWFLRHHQPETKWVLFLDADEYLTESFKNELRTSLANTENVGFWLNYSIYFLGKPLKGGYPLKKLALFRVGAGEYEKIDEDQWSRLDMEVHEHPVLTGPVGVIHSKIDHRDERDLRHYIAKHNEYASWEAARYVKLKAETTSTNHLSWKQRLKYRLSGSIWIAPVYFFGCFFLMGGFRDGGRGFAFAILKMAYFVQVYCKIKELQLSWQRQSITKQIPASAIQDKC